MTSSPRRLPSSYRRWWPLFALICMAIGIGIGSALLASHGAGSASRAGNEAQQVALHSRPTSGRASGGVASDVSASARRAASAPDRRLPRARMPASTTAGSPFAPDAGSSVGASAAETRWLLGSVVDAIGGPIAGARVSMTTSPNERSATARVPSRVALSDARGRFRARVPRTALLVEATAEGYGVARKVLTAAVGGVQLVLVAGGSISGNVVREGNVPVPGALVQVSPKLRQLVGGEARTDDSGHFFVSSVPAGVVSVTASADGLQQTSEWVRLGVGEAYGPMLLRLSPGRSIAGAIRVNGAPCASGSVQLDGPVASAASIGPDGAYRIDGVSPGRHWLTALCDEAAPAARSLDVDETPGVTQLDWEVDAGLSLHGIVVHSTGEPAAGVSVMVTAQASSEPASEEGSVLAQTLMMRGASSCSSAADGRFSCGGLLPGWYVAAPVTARGAGDGSEPVHLDERSSPEVRLVLVEAATIEVTLAEPPAPDAPFPGVYARGSRPWPVAAVPRGDAFVLDNLPLDRYRVSIGRGIAPPGPDTAEVTLDRPGQVAHVQLRRHAPSSISGRVLDGNAAPVPEAWVYASLALPGIPIPLDAGQPVMTDADGHFELAGLEPGEYRVRAVHDLGEGQLQEVTAGGDGVNVILETYGEVHGRVAFENGQPVPRFSVMIARQPVGEPVTANGEGGRWSARWLAPGQYRIAALSESGGAVGSVRIEPGRAVSIDSVLDPGLAGSKITGAWKTLR